MIETQHNRYPKVRYSIEQRRTCPCKRGVVAQYRSAVAQYRSVIAVNIDVPAHVTEVL